MSSLDKRILKQDAQNQERDAIYFKQEYENALNRIQFLVNENTKLNKQILDLQMKLKELEEKQSNPTPISRAEEPTKQQNVEEPIQQPNTPKPNQQEGLDPEEVIADILAALKY